MRLEEATCRRLLTAAPVARLATIGPDGPHIVPVVFAVAGDSVLTVVDAKPKSTTRLQRIRNLENNPRAAILGDHYADDWTQLWWVRADATAIIEHSPEKVAAALPALQAKYPQYVAEPPRGPLVRLRIQQWSGWSATPVDDGTG
jgi:PPOX class probable F420-dependent enzyme